MVNTNATQAEKKQKNKKIKDEELKIAVKFSQDNACGVSNKKIQLDLHSIANNVLFIMRMYL